MERHFTATVYVIENNQILLHPHKKLGKWLPPGGHLEPNETPLEAAEREVKEETGLDLIFLSEESVEIDFPNATSFTRPYLCLLENIPSYKEVPAHQHIDFIYVARPLDESAPNSPFRWISLEELAGLDLFPDTRKVAHLLLQPDYQRLSDCICRPRLS